MLQNIAGLGKGGEAQDSPCLHLWSSYEYHDMQPNTMGSLSMVGVFPLNYPFTN